MIELKNINKIVKNSSKDDILILKDITLSFKDNGLYFISGKSGSGKTSILNILCGISSFTSGEFLYNNELIDYKQANSLTKIYNESSFVFQSSLFISKLSVIENIKIIGLDNEEEIKRVLEYVDLYKCKDTNVSLLSGGEKQRLSIAISLIKGAKYIVLDEPTASLDYENKIKVMDLLKQISKDKLIIMASHDQEIINEYADYVYEIDNGEITNFIDVRDDSLSINIIKNNKDYIFQVYEKLKRHNSDYIIVDDKKINIDKNNLLLSLSNIFDKYDSRNLVVKFIDENKENDTCLKLDFNSRPDLSFRLQLKYAFSFFTAKKFKSFLLIILFTFSLLLLSFQLNINSLKSYDVNYNNFKKNDSSYISIYKNELNDNLNEKLRIYSGKELKKELIDNNIVFLEYTSLDISNNEIRLYIIDSKISFNKYEIDCSNDEIILTKTAYSLLEDNHCYINNNELDNVNFSFFDEFVDYDILNSYKNNSLKPYESDKLNNDIFIGFISKTYYLELMNQCEVFYERIPSKTIVCDDYDKYNRRVVEYDYISYPELKDNEIIISKSLLSEIGYSEEEIQNKSLYNINIKESKNYKRYMSYINLYDVYDELIVKDVVDNSNRIIYISGDYYNKYLNETLDYFNLSVNVEKYNYVKKISELNYDYDSFLVNNSNNFINLVNKQFRPILLAFLVILTAISFILIMIFSNTNFNNNLKEVCLMKAYGIKTRKIISSFFLYNVLILISSLIISFILYLVSIKLINSYLMTPDILNINFIVINPKYILLLFLALIVLIVSFVSTIIPTYKIRKYDLYNLIKE